MWGILIIVHFDGLKLIYHFVPIFLVKLGLSVVSHSAWLLIVWYHPRIILSQVRLLFLACHLGRPETITVQVQYFVDLRWPLVREAFFTFIDCSPEFYADPCVGMPRLCHCTWYPHFYGILYTVFYCFPHRFYVVVCGILYTLLYCFTHRFYVVVCGILYTICYCFPHRFYVVVCGIFVHPILLLHT